MPDATPTPAPFTPFADDSAARSIGGLSIENGSHRITLHGSLDITRDKAGLAQARLLRETFAAIERVLEQGDLPDHVAQGAEAPTRRVKNPFA